MPPKAKASAAPSKKTEQKKKEKVIEDKTFGLKNKKGAKQQRFIQQVEKQVKFGGNPSNRKLEETKKQERDKKDAKLKEAKELNMLFKPVATQKVEKGTDPKSVLCAFYKQGQCTKGDKCKFSHDLTLERKAEKRSMYHDMRDSEETMEDWDEEKLKEVVEKKHAEFDKRPTTDIICKYFIDAVEKSKYGWFWECPSGSKCIYRHALPPGFVLKKDKKKDEKKDEISIEDLIERERASLGSSLTKVTLETFIAWKKRKIMEKEESARKDEEKKRTEYKAGRQIGLSGREMFTFNPEMASADQYEEGDDAFDTGNLPDDDNEENIEYREIVLDSIVSEAQEADGTGTKAAEDRLKASAAESAESNGIGDSMQNGVKSDSGTDSGASVSGGHRNTKGESDDDSNGDSDEGSDSGENAAGAVGVPIDENLFLDEDLGDGLDEFELNL
ncbi:zinc finger CCCH domain-containing protein 15 homolog [Ischnura elegans]|uniref:zinc finger CCCH domain-containing protein 15 homolog n=1 Tax=Ischnura elegans TaxID=197161 RepID=UPI001ED89C70|nr:zinc finger CCCH domain-containing protein 15 homolog [Ischnura elegans]